MCGRSWHEVARARVGAVAVDVANESEVVSAVISWAAAGRGGALFTPNMTIARMCAEDQRLQEIFNSADILVCDGMPLIWAGRLAGTKIPERVTGSSLIWSISEAAARSNLGIYLLGGEAGHADLASTQLTSRIPELEVTGTHSPPFGFERVPGTIDHMIELLRDAGPAVVFVGLGAPKQEQLIQNLKGNLPQMWFIACGAAIAMAAGARRRAPRWMQRMGLEWLHRLSLEPRRLAPRYLADARYGLELIAWAVGARLLRVRDDARQGLR